MRGDYLQIAYVTNDFDRAIAEVGATHGIGSFKEMRSLTIDTTDGRQGTSHYALAFRGDTEFEIIAPIDGAVGVYRGILPYDGSYALAFHHIGQHLADRATFERTRSDVRARWPMPIDAQGFGGRYCYADARADRGHYLEYFSFPDHMHLDGVPRY